MGPGRRGVGSTCHGDELGDQNNCAGLVVNSEKLARCGHRGGRGIEEVSDAGAWGKLTSRRKILR